MWNTLFGLIVICTIVGFALIYALCSSETLEKMFLYLGILNVVIWVFLTRIISIGIYVNVMQFVFVSDIFNASIQKQVSLIISPFVILLIANAYSDRKFFQNYFSSFPVEQRIKIRKNISFATKVLATIVVAFVLGIKDTAYALIEQYNVELIEVFVFDLFVMYISATLICLDLAASEIVNNHPKIKRNTKRKKQQQSHNHK